jgi:ribosomal protein S18 acetylase RimI-like enzyme
MSIMGFNIRNATLEDLDAITTVEALCFPPEEAASRASLEQRLKTFPYSFFVAEKNGEIIGFVNGCVINGTVIHDELYKNAALHIPHGDYQTIFGLDVIPDFQCQGIGTLLMQYMIDVSEAAGRRGLILTCKEDLIPYYEKLGFVNKGISKSVHGGAVWYDMMMEF